MALHAESISRELAERHGCVAWDRVRLIGQAQQRLRELRDRRHHGLGGEGVIVVERRSQPLEALPRALSYLRRGRPVVVRLERGGLRSSIEILRRMSAMIGPALSVCEADALTPAYAEGWPEGGVDLAAPRIGFVDLDADEEVAAYLLARSCLRRTGFDPRSVHRVVVAGHRPRLERHLRRLWLGVKMGPPDDPSAFAGPVGDEQADRFHQACAQWEASPGVEVLCPGARLERPDGGPGRRYVAPALFRSESADTPDDPPELVGPMLILEVVEPGDAERRLAALAPRDGHALWLRFGRPKERAGLARDDRQIEGALLIERLPPGLPAPRP